MVKESLFLRSIYPFTISIKSVLILIDGLILLKYFRPLPMIWYTVYSLDQIIFTE